MATSKKNVPAVDYTNRLQPGVRGEIVIDAGVYRGRYPSIVEDIGEDTVAFAHPLYKSMPLPAYRDMEFLFVIFDGAGAILEFPMAVRRSDLKAGLPLLWSRLLDYPKRVQRRKFLRVSCLWDALLFHLSGEMGVPMSGRWFKAKIIDVSLGGYRFRTTHDAKFEGGDKILVRFNLSDREYFLLGRASRIVSLPQNGWEVGVGLNSLAASVEKKLLEFIRQQEMLGRE